MISPKIMIHHHTLQRKTGESCAVAVFLLWR